MIIMRYTLGNVSSTSLLKIRNSLLFLLLTILLSSCSHQLVVGIAETCSGRGVTAGQFYVNAVARGGNIPLVIPDNEYAEEVLRKVDLLLLIGGEDVNPAYYGAEPSPNLGDVNGRRDTFEMRLIKKAIDLKLPIFGICRGEQIMNVAFGGTLYQDLPSEVPSNIAHRQGDKMNEPVHTIVIDRDSRLFDVLQTPVLGVNSSHHQAVKQLAPGFRICARSKDNVVEAIESDRYPAAGVQFHPEMLAVGSDQLYTRIFKNLKKLAGK